jgi:ketosteroid isomerase-like protein
MNTAVLGLTLLLLLDLQAPSGTPPTDVARAIGSVEARFEEALEKRDRAALNELLTESFIWIHALDGRVDPRSTFLDQTARGLGLSRQRAESSTFDRTLAVYGSAAIRTARVRIRFRDSARETWIRQNRVFVVEGGQWKLASGQGTRMYDGPVTTSRTYEPYAGTYRIDAKRSFRLEWDGDALLATYPSGARSQVFLKSPAEEAVQGPDRLRFVLNEGGRPVAVLLLRGEEQVWRGERVK